MPFRNIENALANPTELQDTTYEVGEIVEHKDRGPGIIAAIITEDTEWYPEPDDDESEVKIEASEDEPAYVVALIEGGSIPADDGDITSGPSELPGEGADPDLDEADETEMSMAPVYEYTDDPYDYEELQQAKRRYIEDRYSWELNRYSEREDVTITLVKGKTRKETITFVVESALISSKQRTGLIQSVLSVEKIFIFHHLTLKR